MALNKLEKKLDVFLRGLTGARGERGEAATDGGLVLNGLGGSLGEGQKSESIGDVGTVEVGDAVTAEYAVE